MLHIGHGEAAAASVALKPFQERAELPAQDVELVIEHGALIRGHRELESYPLHHRGRRVAR